MESELKKRKNNLTKEAINSTKLSLLTLVVKPVDGWQVLIQIYFENELKHFPLMKTNIYFLMSSLKIKKKCTFLFCPFQFTQLFGSYFWSF